MKLTEIRIVGYKSIDDLSFPIKKHGTSYTTILLGKNETGKSNVLSALALLNEVRNGTKVDFSAIKKQIDPEPETVSVFYSLEPENDTYRDFVAAKLTLPESLVNKIKVTKAVEEVWLQDGNDQYGKEWKIDLIPNILKDVFYVQKTMSNGNDVEKNTYSIKDKKELTEEELGGYSELNWDKFVEIVQPTLEEYFNMHEIPVSVWRAKDSDLIQGSIPLKEFSEKPSAYPALQNMFALSGFVNKEQIQRKIQEIEKNSNHRRKLDKKLSDESTKYINTKWKEHKVKIDARISDELNIQIKVQDGDNEDCYYDMRDRSEGFKQFISLLLSISIKNQSGIIKDNLIIIDEPEVHLHPSGIRYMLEELVKIGKNNYVFLATHSNFMIDRNAKERHFLLTKRRGVTQAKQVSSDENLCDDEILLAAFGVDAIRDFLSPYKLLVEGASDKILLQKALGQVAPELDIRITNGNGNNIVAIASKLAFDDVYPIVIVDDDIAGQTSKESILKIKGGFNEDSVYTIRDLVGSIKHGATVEDTLPNEYLQTKANSVLTEPEHNLPNIELTEDNLFCEQLVKHLQTSLSKDGTLTAKQQKEKLNMIMDEVKTKISSDYDTKNIDKKAPILFELAQAIAVKFKHH